MDRTSDFFFMEKVDMVITRTWRWLLQKTGYAIHHSFIFLRSLSCSFHKLVIFILEFQTAKALLEKEKGQASDRFQEK